MFDNKQSLDPADWEQFRRTSHRALDDMLNYVAGIAQRPVWQPAPKESGDIFQMALPLEPSSLEDIYTVFLKDILPYAVGNAHPGFMGWAHGGGTVVGLLAEMLAAGLNANLGGRDHVPIVVEQQVVRWMQELYSFPEGSSGIFVTGSSIANFMGLLIARRKALGAQVRTDGVNSTAGRLVVYASSGTHGCIARAMDMAGIGSASLCSIGVDPSFRIDIDQLEQSLVSDRRAGKLPFCIVGNAGTVDVGAIDDLSAIAAICQREKLWFHVDGACGALGMLSSELAPRFKGIQWADSLALDFHKWGQVPYDAGFLLVRDRALHHATFAAPAAYLGRAPRGLAGGSVWPCDYGPDLSRSFKALKVWFTLRVYGIERLGRMMATTCQLARYLAALCEANSELELLAPVALNIVCFRFRSHDADAVNAKIVVSLQESGLAAPSSTLVDGKVAIRAAIFNHRTTAQDLDRLVEATVKFGRQFHATGETREA